MQPRSRDLSYNAETTTAEPLDFSDNGEWFDFYFGDTMDDHSLVGQEPTNLDAEPQRTASVQPQYDDNNVEAAQRATFLFVLEQVEHLIRPSDSDAENATTLAQRVASANALSPEELRAFSDSILEQLRTTAVPRQIDPAFDTPQLDQEGAAPLSDAMRHSNIVPNFPPQSHNPSLPDQPLSDPFAPIQWDDSELWNSNPLSPDPTTRTFFPEIDLIMSP